MATQNRSQQLRLTVETDSGDRDVDIDVRRAFNFGYAARDTAGIDAHIAEMRELGMPAPTRLPAIFPIPADRVQTATEISVFGEDTYGEVEFALIATDAGWLVTIASDHTDLEVEKINMAKAKATCPDVVGDTAWFFDEVADHWDECTMQLWGRTPDGQEHLIQSGSVGLLLRPEALQEILAERSGTALDAGTVIMSGTIDGAPTPGMSSWRAELADPRRGRKLAIDYHLNTSAEL